MEAEFDSLAEFDESAVLQDLLDNYNTDNKTENKEGQIIRTFVCKFSKKKKGFNCPVKSRTVLTGTKMAVFRLEDCQHDHTVVDHEDRKNFNFDDRVEAKMKELLEMNVSSRNMRKHLIKAG